MDLTPSDCERKNSDRKCKPSAGGIKHLGVRNLIRNRSQNHPSAEVRLHLCSNATTLRSCEAEILRDPECQTTSRHSGNPGGPHYQSAGFHLNGCYCVTRIILAGLMQMKRRFHCRMLKRNRKDRRGCVAKIPILTDGSASARFIRTTTRTLTVPTT